MKDLGLSVRQKKMRQEATKKNSWIRFFYFLFTRFSSFKKSSEKHSQIVLLSLFILCLFCFYQLIFSNGGMLHYYKQLTLVEGRTKIFEELSQSNQDLRKKIDLFLKTHVHQKRMIRKHLGMIEKDEYIIIFAQENN